MMKNLMYNNGLFLSIICLQILLISAIDPKNKKGLVHYSDDYLCGDLDALPGVHWWYDYQNTPSDEYCQDIENLEYVPMIWDINDDTDTPGEAKIGLTYNEPNIKSQSNIEPKDAADRWPEVEKALEGKQITSPSASTCNGDDCLYSRDKWFKVFFEHCTSCNVDFIATHAYGCDAYKVMKDLKNLSKNNNGKKILLTEFTCGNLANPNLMLIFMKQILPELELEPCILGYSWYKGRVIPPKDGTTEFVAPAASLLEQNEAKRTPLGDFYNNYKPGENVEIEVPQIPPADPSNLVNEDCPIEDKTGADKKEVLAILKEYDTNPTAWWKILYSLKHNMNDYSEVAAAFYLTAKTGVAKNRIQDIFEILFGCAGYIKDPELKTKIAEIKSWERDEDAKGLEVPTIVVDTNLLVDLFNENCKIDEKTGAKVTEVWAILNTYETRPTEWWKIITPLQKNSVADGFYVDNGKKVAKARINDIFNILFCCKDSIMDAVLKTKITEIESMPLDEDKKGLQVPCT